LYLNFKVRVYTFRRTTDFIHLVCPVTVNESIQRWISRYSVCRAHHMWKGSAACWWQLLAWCNLGSQQAVTTVVQNTVRPSQHFHWQ